MNLQSPCHHATVSPCHPLIRHNPRPTHPRAFAAHRSLPLIIILAAFLWSALTIAFRRTEEAPPNTVTLRIGHWQLETGVRDAFNQLAADFAALPEIRQKYGNVRIVQDAIPDSSYGQWLTSQMMGETAPDLVEMGMLSPPILLSYENRYFLPLTPLVHQPNPFNRGTPLEGVPLMDTFTDGMRSGYTEELQSFTKIPLSRFTSRVFYNKTLLTRLTGQTKPPRDLAAFLDLCRQIGKQPLPNSNQHYIPIAASSWHLPHWLANIAEPLTYTNLFLADASRDGGLGVDETYAAIVSGRMRLSDPPWHARFEVTRALTEQFNPGFAGVGRDEALFLFAQQKAVFISTGIWDVSSLQDQARGRFQVGIADFPRPSPTDPKYGRFALGPLYDPAWAAFPFGIYRLSKHPDLAQDFLLYLASARGNEKLNRIIGWIPVVTGAPIPPALAGFEPVNQGLFANGDLALGGNTLNAYNKAFSEFLTNPDYPIDAFERDLTRSYLKEGQSDWPEYLRDNQRSAATDERTLAALRGQALLDAALHPQSDPLHSIPWRTYRNYFSTREILLQLEHHPTQALVDSAKTPAPESSASTAPESATPSTPRYPYDFRPEALQRARQQLSAPSPISSEHP